MFHAARSTASISRRRPSRTGVWFEGTNGERSLVERDGTRYDVYPVAGKWRLDVARNGVTDRIRGNEEWEGDSPGDCMGMAEFIRHHADLHARWSAGDVPSFEKATHLPGVIVRAAKTGGRIHATAHETGTGELLGWFHAGYTQWRGAWVLGEETVNTSSHVTRAYVGLGLGRMMHDLVEEVAGLPLAPHGLNHVGGGLTADSRRFWDRRSGHVRVPGFGDAAVDARRDVMDRVSETLVAEGRWPDTMLALGIAVRTGLPVEVLVDTGEGKVSPVRAWCAISDEVAYTGRGLEERNRVEAEARDEIASTEASLVRSDAKGLGALIGMDWGRGKGEVVEPSETDLRLADRVLDRHALEDPVPEGPCP